MHGNAENLPLAAPYERMAIKRACDKTFICFFTSSFLSLSSCQFHSLFLSPEIIRNQTQQCPSPCKRIADQQNFHLMMDLRKNHDPRKSYKEQSSKRIPSARIHLPVRAGLPTDFQVVHLTDNSVSGNATYILRSQ